MRIVEIHKSIPEPEAATRLSSQARLSNVVGGEWVIWEVAIEHPEWYVRGIYANFVTPVADWSDVIDLNYDMPGLWDYMIDAMKFWVEEVDVDGFRCDVAGMVPLDFWNRVRFELDKIKPVFMLAEWESPEPHEKAFDMTCGWELYKLMNRLAKGVGPAIDIVSYLERDARTYPGDAYRMYFTSSHDENSWDGTIFWRLTRTS
jgi:glycosidase